MLPWGSLHAVGNNGDNGALRVLEGIKAADIRNVGQRHDSFGAEFLGLAGGGVDVVDGALVQLNGDIFLFYNKSLGDLNVEKLALIMASATPATHAPSGSSSLTEDMGVWGLRPLC